MSRGWSTRSAQPPSRIAPARVTRRTDRRGAPRWGATRLPTGPSAPRAAANSWDSRLQ